MKITAPVYKILPLQEFESGFKKRVLVVKTTEEYSQTLPIEFTKDRASLLDGIAEGQIVTVNYAIKGNEYNGKFYVNLFGLGLDAEDNGNAVIATEARKMAEPKGDMAQQFNESQHLQDAEDDLPF